MGRRARRDEAAHSAQFDLFAGGALSSEEAPRKVAERSVATPLETREIVVTHVERAPLPLDASRALPRATSPATVDATPLVDADVDAVVVPTTSTLRGTTPLEVAVRARAGRGLGRALDEIRDRAGGVRVGDVVVTPGFGLRAKHVVFVVPPRRRGDLDDEALRAMCLRIVDAARSVGARSMAIDVESLLRRGFVRERSAPLVVVALMRAAADMELRFVVDDPGVVADAVNAAAPPLHDDASVAVHMARRSV